MSEEMTPTGVVRIIFGEGDAYQIEVGGCFVEDGKPSWPRVILALMKVAHQMIAGVPIGGPASSLIVPSMSDRSKLKL